MILLGFIAGVVLLALTGAAVVVLLMRNAARVNLLECFGLGWILGVGLVSFLLWLIGLLFNGPGLAFFVVACCLTICYAGWRSARRSTVTFDVPRPRDSLEWSLLTILLAQIAVFFWVAMKQPLGWDGLLVWEIKARYAFLSENILPASYFNGGRAFSHPEYPLAVPFAELWLYLWMGDANQFWIKAFFPIFYAAGMILLAVFAARITGKTWAGLLAAILFFFVPQASLGTGGASSGYVDFPLSLVYGCAIAYLITALDRDFSARFNCYAACLALLPWFKRDGSILWLIAAAAGVICVFVRRKSPRMLFALVPGAVIALAWNIFLRLMHTPHPPEFVSPNLSIFLSNIGRLGGAGRALFFEMTDLQDWGVFWLLSAVALIYLIMRARRLQSLVLLAAIVLPVVAYSSVYIFSAWPDYLRHIGASISRLLIHVALLLWLAIASAFSSPLRNRTIET